MLIVAIGIKLTSPGPVLFKQNRYGLNGKQIQVWKFRTMRVMENSAVVTQATRNDPRITKFGAFCVKPHWMNCHNLLMSCRDECLLSAHVRMPSHIMSNIAYSSKTT